MTTQKVLAVLTGGGDCPGLNPAIKAVTKSALLNGYRVIGVRDGYKGLINYKDPTNTFELNADNVRHIDRMGGTMLGSSRTNPFKVEDGPERIRDFFNSMNITGLVAIGGEDTLGVASRIHSELKLPVVGIPKTIDRDLGATDYSLGFESAVQVITDSVDNLRSTAESHARIFVVEAMGRHAGHLALRGGIAAGASVILIPEHDFNVDQVCAIIKRRKEAKIRYSIVLVAEGAKPDTQQALFQSNEKDAFGHVRLGGISEWLAREIEQRIGVETRAVNLSHLQRGGQPVAYDRRIGFYMGCAAVEAVEARQFGNLAGLKDGHIRLLPLADAVKTLRVVEVARMYDTQNYCASRKYLNQTGYLE